MEQRGVYADTTVRGGAKKKYCRTTHKFVIKLPKKVEDALNIDDQTGSDLREKCIRKDMKHARIAFEKINDVTLEQIRTGNLKPQYNY